MARSQVPTHLEQFEEDATELQFPKEFENAETLLISEVKKFATHFNLFFL